MGPEVLSIWNRSTLAHPISPWHLNICCVGALCASPALWDQSPHSGVAPSSRASQPGSEHRVELRCDGRRGEPPSHLPRLPSPLEAPQGWMEVGYLHLAFGYL